MGGHRVGMMEAGGVVVVAHYSQTTLIIYFVDTEFLFIHGADDQVCDVVNQSKMIQRLRKHNLYNFESHTYPGTGHMIEPPFRAICNNSYHPGFKRPILYGGEREPQARAQREIWRLVLDFFHRHLG